MGHLDGRLRLDRRRVQQLRAPPGRGQDRAGRRVHPRLPAQARRPAERAHDPAGTDQGPGDLAAAVIPEALLVDRGVSAGDSWLTVDPAKVHDALSALKDEGYSLLVFLTCVDHLLDSSRNWPARYELLYELRNLETREQVRVRASWTATRRTSTRSTTSFRPPTGTSGRPTTCSAWSSRTTQT